MITEYNNAITRSLLKTLLHDLCASLDDSVLDEIVPHMEKLTLNRGDILVRQGDSSFSIFIVIEGRFQAKIAQKDGTEVIAGEIGQGEPIGEIQALTGGAHTATVYARTDAAAVLRLLPEAVEIITKRSPETVRHMFSIARKRLLQSQLATLLPTIFESLDDTALRDISTQVEWIHLRRGEVLFHEGEQGDSLYIVLFGRLRIALKENEGERVLDEVARGDIIGEVALLTSEPRSATVYAVRECDLVRFSQSVFEGIVNEYPQVMTAITRTLVTRLIKRTRYSPYEGININVAVVPVSRNAYLDEFSARLSGALSSHGRVLHLNSSRIEGIIGTSQCRDIFYSDTLSMKLAAWLSEQETHYAYIIYEADASTSPWTLCCLGQADQILLVAQSSDLPESSPIEKSALPQITDAVCSMVILHAGREQLPSNTGEWLRSWNVVNHQHVCGDEDDDFKRLARVVTNTTVSLVLSGGGARGFAHIGVIRALREAGIPVDVIGGTSMGAVIASAYAMGWDDQKIYNETKNIFVTNSPLNDYTFPIISFFRCRNLDRVLKKNYGDTRIEDLWTRYFCISTNLSIAEIELHDHDVLWKAVRASISYPGIAVPVVKGNHLLVDGGVLNNLPIDIMKTLCRGSVIAVDVSVEEDLTVNESEFPSPWKIVWDRISPFKKYSKFPNILDILTRTVELSCINRKQQTIVDADLYLRPPVDKYKLLDFQSFDELVNIGYAYAKEEIKKWNKTKSIAQHINNSTRDDMKQIRGSMPS